MQDSNLLKVGDFEALMDTFKSIGPMPSGELNEQPKEKGPIGISPDSECFEVEEIYNPGWLAVFID